MSKEHQRVNVSILGLIAISNNKKSSLMVKASFYSCKLYISLIKFRVTLTLHIY